MSSHAEASSCSPWVFVAPASATDLERCRRLSLPVAPTALPSQWTVHRTHDGLLTLRAPVASGPLEFAVDLRTGPLAKRLRTARRDQPLPRAVGLPRWQAQRPLRLLDATAGLGRDTLLLARLGCAVVACERIPVLAVLIDDAVVRAGLGDRVSVHCCDAAEVLTDAAEPFDAVYLDPMFAVHGSAQVKKDMQICRLLAGDAQSTEPLLQRARAKAPRVVVKRHPHLQPLAGAPTFTVDGERVRFDVYVRS